MKFQWTLFIAWRGKSTLRQNKHKLMICITWNIWEQSCKSCAIKKTTFRKKLLQTESFALSQFLVAILFKKCYPQKVYVHQIFQNWSSVKVFVRRMTKGFPNFLLICHIFSNFLNGLLYVVSYSQIPWRNLSKEKEKLRILC